VALALLLASCGAPATPAPDLPPTPERATRVPVVMPTEANADQAGRAEPTAVAVQPSETPRPTRALPTLTPTITLIPPTATPAPPTSTPQPSATPPPDPARGEQLFHDVIAEGVPTCVSCHLTEPATDEELVGVQGPSMVAHGDEPGIAIRAQSRVPGETPAEYLRNSILHPNDYLVPNSTIPGKGMYAIAGTSVMYQLYADVLTPDQVNDLVAYLLTIR
ncbi:MAG: c-type cytochrome, partial [Anaerolineae bacterium]|nr:c-type cytochrome [Anaerolineae bacterium]